MAPAAAAAPPIVMILPADWEQRQQEITREVVREELDRREARKHPLSAQECAALYTGGSMAKWRSLRHYYPCIDERALAGGKGRLMKWDADRLALVMAELSPKLRRRAARTS